jgi:hypothetical protein
MPSPLEALFNLEAEIDAEGRIRLPPGLLAALRVGPGDRLRFTLGHDGSAQVHDAAKAPAPRAAGGTTTPLMALASGLLAEREGAEPASAAALAALLHQLAGEAGKRKE